MERLKLLAVMLGFDVSEPRPGRAVLSKRTGGDEFGACGHCEEFSLHEIETDPHAVLLCAVEAWAQAVEAEGALQ